MNDYLNDTLIITKKNVASELAMKLMMTVKNRNYDYCCVVEGETDERFYCHVNHPFFRRNNVGYISAHYSDSYDEYAVGKKAVVDTCRIIMEKFHNDFKRCVFIVDHDYFGLEEFESNYSKMCLDSITILPVYSFENYFTLNKNLQWIIQTYLPRDEHEAFITNFNDFSENLIYYCALKGTITKCHQNRKYRIDYTKENDDWEIFRFNFHENQYYDSESMNNEIRNMIRSISEYPELVEGVECLRVKLSKHRDLLKGKILYNFVKYYLLHNNDIRALDQESDDYAQVVSNLKVKINVVINDNRV